MTTANYGKDFYAWALYNAELIRTGKFSEVDRKNVAEELESMGKSEKRELINRFAILLAHLLKWQFQSARRGNSWKYTIEEQRDEVLDLLEDSPSLKHELSQKLDRAYRSAVLLAATETGLSKEAFPAECPFSIAETLRPDFLPNNE